VESFSFIGHHLAYEVFELQVNLQDEMKEHVPYFKRILIGEIYFEIREK
jgi:hypothetical protein